LRVYVGKRGEGQEIDIHTAPTGNWSEVVYTLGAEARFTQAGQFCLSFLGSSVGTIFRRIRSSGWLPASVHCHQYSVKTYR